MAGLFSVRLYRLLDDRRYYSLEINHVSGLLDVDIDYWSSPELSSIFQRIFNDKINTFTFNGVTYIGLESRRIDYERDKLMGTNWVEDAIKRGEYDW